MSRDFKADLAILISGQWGRHEEDWFKNNGIEIAVSAIEQALSEKERADKYEALVHELTEALQLYESWEAKVIMDNSLWQSASGLPFITQEVWDELVAIQTERNKVLHKAKEVLGDGEVR